MSLNSIKRSKTNLNMSKGQIHALTLTCFLLVIGNAFGAHIAFFTPTGSYSHRVSLWPLVQKLVEKGNQITFISAYPPKDPLENVTELVPERMAKYANDYMQGGLLDVTKRISGEHELGYDHLPTLGLYTCEMFLDDPGVKKWLNSDLKIDLFVVDWCVSECILGLAYKQKAPFIFYAPTVMVAIFYETFGFLPDTAGIPDYEHHYSPPMTFWERGINALQPIIWKYKMSAYYEDLGKMLREKMNIPDMPPLEDIVRNASLMMWSESVIEGYAHSIPPNWITVGGMHCKEKPDPLPKDLEAVVQKGKDGFIYISFGSAVVPANLPKGHREAFFNGIASFPNIQFLWKWTGEMPKEKLPSNLHIGKWFPQQDLLAHKRILGFVTQAGRPSTQEAIFHGVPIIAMPVFEDQDYTAEKVQSMGGGVIVEIATLKQHEFEDAIRNITANQKFKETMMRLSKLFKDRPMKPADTALWWTEYVLRHKGDLNHLRSPSFNLTWYERRHLDFWALITIAALLVIRTLGHFVLLCLDKLLFSSKPSATPISTKKSKKVKRKDD